MNDLLMEIISLKNRLHPAPLDIKARHFFHMACYDLDAFRDQLDNFNFDPETSEAAKNDDIELLKLGMEWIKKTLF